MNVNEMLTELDHLFEMRQIEKVEPFLLKKLDEVSNEGDDASAITILNELIGFYRDMSQYEKSIACCRKVESIMVSLGLEGTTDFATTMLNIGNAMRAAHQLKESMDYYQKVLKIYKERLDKNDFLFASLNNNMSLLYQEMGEFEKASECLLNALAIACQYENAVIEQAVTHINLSTTYVKLKKIELAMEHAIKALEIFNRVQKDDENTDFHYGGALSSMAEILYIKGDYEHARMYYEKALHEIEKHVGKTEAYEVVLSNYHRVMEKLSIEPKKQYISGMENARAFYNQYRDRLVEDFKEYEKEMAFGLTGHGSWCFGFDDELSKDHDYPNGFCVFLPQKTYDIIGNKLQEKYDEVVGREEAREKRLGVFSIEAFFESLLYVRDVPKTKEEWLLGKPEAFATACNGEIFEDNYGMITRIRAGLKNFYPGDIRIPYLANELTLMAQTMQYNYSRMLQRKDNVTVITMIAKYVDHTMNVIYYLNKKYPPFYKWKFKGIESLSVLNNLRFMLEELVMLAYDDEKIPIIVEQIAEEIIEELDRQGLYKQGLNKEDETYLALVADELVYRKELIERMVQEEWEAFDLVENIGGRADCQDDWKTFQIMRTSQYLTFPTPVIESYLNDFLDAKEKGWNLITEKYGRMMESTDRERFLEIKESLPKLTNEKSQIIEEIVKIQISFMEEFAKVYPNAVMNTRSIHTWEDNQYNTSYETYLRGELSTYSDETLLLYGRFIASCGAKGNNLAKNIMEHTAKLYGYANLDDLEKRLG